jgi:hypothetical protein
MVLDEEDNANFLDNDEIEGVSDNLYDWTFDQVVVLGVPSIAAEERSPVNWYCPNPLKVTKAMRVIGRQYDLSFSLVVQNAFAHGFSIALHKHAQTIDMINALDDAATMNDSEEYFEHLTYKPILGRDVRRMVTVTDSATAELAGNNAAILGTSRSHFAGYCILLSLITGDLVPQTSKKEFEKHINYFENGLKSYTFVASKLI